MYAVLLTAACTFPVVYAQTSANRQNYFLESSMYQGFSSAACTRLHTAQGTIGCSALKLVSGTLYRVSSVSDVQAFAANAPSGVMYVVVMPGSLMTIDVINTLRGSGKLTGIFTITDSIHPPGYSPEMSCPNCAYGLYANQPTRYLWNPSGNSLVNSDFDFPIFGIHPGDPTSIQTINAINEVLDFNAARKYINYPLYAMELDSRMSSAIDSSTCLRRKRCQPLGGYSVWSTFSSGISANDQKPIVFVASKIDSTALLHDYGFGAGSRSGVVAMLAVVETLSRVQGGMASLPKTVVFSAFEAESWAFAGSQRMVQDMSQPLVCKDTSGKPTSGCPVIGAQCNSPCLISTDFTKLNIDLIESFIEFDSIGDIHHPAGATSPHYLHVDTLNPQTSALVDSFKSAASPAPSTPRTSQPINVTIDVAATASNTNNRLPPSSAMAFLARRGDIPAMVVTDYLSQFSNPYYHSQFDDGSTWTADHVAAICGVVGTMSRGIYARAGGQTTNAASIIPNCTLVGQLMECFTRNVSCPLFQQLKVDSQSAQFSGYSSVYIPTSISPMTMLSNLLMINWTASEVVGNCSDTRCTKLPSDYRCSGNRCMLSMTRLHRAFGTGLEASDSGIYTVVDPKRGTWTESSWDTTRLRVFKVSSLAYQGMQLGVGLALTIGTGILTWYLRSKFRMHIKKDRS
ncbi:hypothetical protein BASA60_003020 [Batrachochytrium salamandrivorans]|nr:hypothetical protein BASA62_006393 [Batrachochytrium salamandrivorans]KAH6580118.1 hypothetical protein BASA60_003020 [Batrachochytrium salamandrivorans]KAH9272949.1 hypothetical protein BASA83_004842 [Batrachochytrium salamandrivorans]